MRCLLTVGSPMGEHRGCATPEVVVDTAAVEGTVPLPATAPPTGPPQAPPDALAVGDAATFPLASGQEIRVTVTDVSTDGTCPEPGAPPPQVGYLFVTMRLEVGAGTEPWRIHSSDLDVRPGGGALGVNDTAESCIGRRTRRTTSRPVRAGRPKASSCSTAPGRRSPTPSAPPGRTARS